MRPESINAIMRNLEPEQRQKFYDAEKEAGEAIGHVGTPSSEFMTDFHNCSCGWESGPYFDGDVYAYEAWLKHITEAGADIIYPQA